MYKYTYTPPWAYTYMCPTRIYVCAIYGVFYNIIISRTTLLTVLSHI